MDDKIIIAIIAASSSLIVSLISLITAIITNRNSLKRDKEIEKLKHQLFRLSKKDELYDTELLSSLESLKLAMQAIQRMKDEIKIFLASSNITDSKESLFKARKNLFDAYEHCHPNLNEYEQSAFHKAKNLSLNLERIVKSKFDAVDNKLSSKDIEYVNKIHSDLTDFQNSLRDNRIERLINNQITIE
jgi:hypothetical protein